MNRIVIDRIALQLPAEHASRARAIAAAVPRALARLVGELGTLEDLHLERVEIPPVRIVGREPNAHIAASIARSIVRSIAPGARSSDSAPGPTPEHAAP